MSHPSIFTLIFRLRTHWRRHRKWKQVWIVSNKSCRLIRYLFAHTSIFTSRHCIVRIIFLFAAQIWASTWCAKWKCNFRRSRRNYRLFPVRRNLIVTRTFHKRISEQWIILSWINLFRTLVNLLIIMNISIYIKITMLIRNFWTQFGPRVHLTVHLSVFLF